MKPVDLMAYLRARPYPGRGIVLGRGADGTKARLFYFIMGRSENSRNRVFERTADGLRTRAYDESKVTDPSLILYHPLRRVGAETVLTNGDQTDTIRDALLRGESFARALSTRTFEPDAPNFTPRISGLLHVGGAYELSILKSLDGDPACCLRYFFTYEAPRPGLGHILHTYREDGDPLPSFEGEPVPVLLPEGSLETAAGLVWDSLNEGNRVSLYAAAQNLDGTGLEECVINRHK